MNFTQLSELARDAEAAFPRINVKKRRIDLSFSVIGGTVGEPVGGPYISCHAHLKPKQFPGGGRYRPDRKFATLILFVPEFMLHAVCGHTKYADHVVRLIRSAVSGVIDAKQWNAIKLPPALR